MQTRLYLMLNITNMGTRVMNILRWKRCNTLCVWNSGVYTRCYKVGLVYVGLHTQRSQGYVQCHVFWAECHRLCGPCGVELCVKLSGVYLMLGTI